MSDMTISSIVKQGWIEKYVKGFSTKSIAKQEGFSSRAVQQFLTKNVKMRPSGRPKVFVGMSSKEVQENWHFRRYGITTGDFLDMVTAQEGKCAICLTVPPPKKDRNGRGRRGLDVDHNHTTGRIRRLLCNMCNKGLGSFRDNPSLLRLAAKYLEENP
jgi:hypothetical protein